MMKTLHNYSGFFLSFYIVIHLFNHCLAYFGPETHIEFMNKIRTVYRHPIIEALIFLSVMIQMYTGLKLYFGAWKKYQNFYDKLQVYSGLYLTLFFPAHISAVLMARYSGLDTNFYFGHSVINLIPSVYGFLPYYSLSIISFVVHMACVWRKLIIKGSLGFKLQDEGRFTSILIMLFGVFLTFFIIFYGTNKFQWYSIPKEYAEKNDDILRLYHILRNK